MNNPASVLHSILSTIAKKDLSDREIDLWPKIYEVINDKSKKQSPIERSNIIPRSIQRRAMGPILIGSISVLILVISVFITSPKARVMAMQALRQIGFFIFEETDQIVFPDLSTGTRLETISEEEARQSVSFEYGLPTWIPEGFTKNPEFRSVQAVNSDVSAKPDSVIARWNSPRGYIGLNIYKYSEEIVKHYKDNPEKVGELSVQEITINGETAVLINGLWGSDQSQVFVGEDQPSEYIWNSQGTGSLFWFRNGLFYLLFWSTAPGIETPLTAKEIIQMAESIP